MDRGIWIVVTGLDGAGKSGLVSALSAQLEARSFRFPYHSFVREGLELSGDGTPFGDPFTDRLLFAADARLTNTLLRRWRDAGELLVSQRGWPDHYVFAAVQGLNYSTMSQLLRPAELEQPNATIHLVADPEVAFARIGDDPNADKFETLEFLRVQRDETMTCFEAITNGAYALSALAGKHLLIDTTELEPAEVYERAREWLAGLKISGT